MKIQITIFLILSTLINLSNTNAQTVSIENNLLTLRIHKQQITIENKKLPDLKVKNILLPGQIITSEKTETSDRLWEKDNHWKLIITMDVRLHSLYMAIILFSTSIQ